MPSRRNWRGAPAQPRSGVRARQFCHHLRQKVHSDPNGTYFSHASESWHPAPFALAQPLEVTGFQLSLEWNDESRKFGLKEVPLHSDPCFADPCFGVFWLRCSRARSEEHTSELPSLMRISYAVFCLQKKKT